MNAKSNLHTGAFYPTFAVLLALCLALGPLLLVPRAASPASTGAPARLESPGEIGPMISSDQAKAIALNDLDETAEGYELRNPRHTARFSAGGVSFAPSGGGPTWRWNLVEVGAESQAALSATDLSGLVQLEDVHPLQEEAEVVSYPRGGLVEQYVARLYTLEQQFVIPEPLDLGGADLLIRGVVRSGGEFESRDDGWLWRTAEGSVSLGRVRVFDAQGDEIAAELNVTAGETRLVVDGAGLVEASYPVTVDPEIGANDFRLSDMELLGDANFGAGRPEVAYNSTNNEYLVVWWGDKNDPPLVNGEYEIIAQRVNAATGVEIGADFRLSDMGPDGDASFAAYAPAVAYNSTNNEYLVAWYGDDNTPPLVDNEFEIFAQRVNAATGAEIGVNDLRLSDMGPDGDASFEARYPAVAYDSAANQYLVVWRGEDDTAPLVDGEREIFAQRVNAATGAEIGADFRLSDMGPDGNANFDASVPAVTYNSTANEYLVVWEGDDNTAPLVDNELEIFAQRVNAATGAEIGADFRLSDMGPDGDASFDARDPAVAYNSAANQYLVAWSGDDNTGTLVDDEWEIFAQRVSATGAEIGADFRLSDMGPDGNPDFDASAPAVAYNSTNNEYLVAWYGDEDTAPLVDNELEIFAQRVNAATGAEIGANDFRLSDMGPDGDASFEAYELAAAYNSTTNEYLVAWYGDDDTAPLVDDEWEIFAQRVNAATGAETGANDFRLSDMGVSGDPRLGAWEPAVAYNSTEDEYLVVWDGDKDALPLVDNEIEIFAQRVDASTGAEIGVDDFRLSDMGPDGDLHFAARDPAIAYNSTDNEYLVVWEGDDNTGGLVDGEDEIFAQRLSATGAEIGANDFRLSDMGPDGDPDFGAYLPAVAYNRANNEYLVVWEADDDTALLVEEEWEIFAQRVSATGAEIGSNDFRLSDMGPDGNPDFGAWDSAVAYNVANNEYLVVWYGDDNTAPLVDDEFEIFAQRVNAATGAEIGANDFRLSDMGPDGDTNFGAYTPAVAYNRANNEYLVVWEANDDTAPLVDNEYEIFAQRVSAAGAEIGADDFRLSDMGLDGDPDFDASAPAVIYNSANNEYLVAWEGDDDIAPLVDGELEIFAQRVSAEGTEIGPDTRLSDMGPDGDPEFDAREPAIIYNHGNNEYLVVWEGDDDTGLLVDGEFDIYAQRFGLPALGLTKSADLSAPQPGQVLTYTITISNIGSTPATGAVISDTLPTGLTFVGPVTLQGSSGTVATDASDLPTLASGVTANPGATVTVTLPVRVNGDIPAGTVIANTAAVTSSEVSTPVAAMVTVTVAAAPAPSGHELYLPVVTR